jgi:hypothetical protein
MGTVQHLMVEPDRCFVERGRPALPPPVLLCWSPTFVTENPRRGNSNRSRGWCIERRRCFGCQLGESTFRQTIPSSPDLKTVLGHDWGRSSANAQKLLEFLGAWNKPFMTRRNRASTSSASSATGQRIIHQLLLETATDCDKMCLNRWDGSFAESGRRIGGKIACPSGKGACGAGSRPPECSATGHKGRTKNR